MSLSRPLFLLILSLFIATNLRAQASSLDSMQTVTYLPHIVNGWTVMVSDGLERSALGDSVLRVLSTIFETLSTKAGKNSLLALRAIPVWVALDIPGFHGSAIPDYHPSKEWLEKNGYDTRWTQSVAIPFGLELLTDGTVRYKVVQGLLDGYCDRTYKYDVPGMGEIMDELHANGKFESFLKEHGLPTTLRSNSVVRVYFDIMSGAYLYGSEDYPHTAAGVKSFDKRTYEILETIWSK